MSHSDEGKRLFKELKAARQAWVKEGMSPAMEAIKAGHYDEVETCPADQDQSDIECRD